MNYAEQQRNPSKHMVGLGVVIVMHIILGWALLNGLARKVVEVVKGPIETKIIEEVKPPPPPPPENLPPPPKLPPPPPAYMPPPEIKIETPPPPAPTITVQTTPPPPAPPVTIAPPPTPDAVPAPPAPVPARVAPQVNFNTDCEKPAYPPAAARAEAMGVVRIKVTVGTDGRATATEIAKSSGPSREHKLLDRAAEAAIKNTCKFKPGTVDGKPETLTTFVEYDWKLN